MMEKVFICFLVVSASFMGCFSAPVEPDWSARAELSLLAENDATILAQDADTLSVDDGFEGEKDTRVVTSEDAVSPEDTEDVAGAEDGGSLEEVQESCPESRDKESCLIVGALRCVLGSLTKVETCTDLGDGCPYWISEFCGGNLYCEDGSCVCATTCPEDDSCGQNDGCGGSCGCEDDLVCSLEGLCECVPACDDNACGQDDGCGGTCMTCDGVWEAASYDPACNEEICADIFNTGSFTCAILPLEEPLSCGDAGETCQSGSCE